MHRVDHLLDRGADRGDCLVVSVNGNLVPTYKMRRLPNWGYMLESCWAIYLSYPMPLKSDMCPYSGLDSAMTVNTEDQVSEIDFYNTLIAVGEEEDEGEA